MNRALRMQGSAFSVVALTLAAATAVLPRLDPRVELLVVAAMIILLGVPHGALDTIFAQKLYQVRSFRGWIGFGVLYGAPAAAVVAVWLVMPTVFLLGFLLISAAHFSGDPEEGTRGLSRLLYGGAVIVLPTLLHADEVDRLFGLLAGSEAAARLTSWLASLAWPWLASLVASALLEARRSRPTGLELLATAALATAAPPLVAFAVFFCGMHSARHILRTIAYASPTAPWLILTAGLLPMALVLAALAIGWFCLADTLLDARLIQFVFVGLAALTVPHMTLIERVRLSGVDLTSLPPAAMTPIRRRRSSSP